MSDICICSRTYTIVKFQNVECIIKSIMYIHTVHNSYVFFIVDRAWMITSSFVSSCYLLALLFSYTFNSVNNKLKYVT